MEQERMSLETLDDVVRAVSGGEIPKFHFGAVGS